MEPNTVLPYVVTAPIPTERLSLRLMTSTDVDDVYAYHSLQEVCRYLLFEPRSRDKVVEKVDEFSKATTLAADGDFLQLALELPPTDDAPARVIGDSFFKLTSIAEAQGEIGWTMNPAFTRRGYAAEAAQTMLGVAFEKIGLHRVIANLDPRNDASVALCLRLGMRREAHFVQDMWFKGEWADTGIYAILREEWLAAR
ncbi:MAG TPA: GNAT family protein [Galbitalea sp.]|jgi:RimJ/RimL family protein N-acetyltransferase|nr:GNAT family protein [Galbitalea sp.]